MSADLGLERPARRRPAEGAKLEGTLRPAPPESPRRDRLPSGEHRGADDPASRGDRRLVSPAGTRARDAASRGAACRTTGSRAAPARPAAPSRTYQAARGGRPRARAGRSRRARAGGGRAAAPTTARGRPPSRGRNRPGSGARGSRTPRPRPPTTVAPPPEARPSASETTTPSCDAHGTRTFTPSGSSAGCPRAASSRSTAARVIGPSPSTSARSGRSARNASSPPRLATSASKRRRDRVAHAACIQARSWAGIRWTVPRTVQVRRRSAASTSARVRPGTRHRSASPAARTSCACTPQSEAAASSADRASVPGASRCAASRNRRRVWSDGRAVPTGG